jgi:hypothetical protein
LQLFRKNRSAEVQVLDTALSLTQTLYREPKEKAVLFELAVMVLSCRMRYGP